MDVHVKGLEGMKFRHYQGIFRLALFQFESGIYVKMVINDLH